MFVLFPFCTAVNPDIEKILEVSFQQSGHDFSCVKADNAFVITSGVNQLVLAMQNERFPRESIDVLISSFSGWSYDELDQLKNHQSLVSIRTPRNPINSKAQVSFIAQVVLTLLRQEGAVGFVNAVAEYYFPVSRFEVYMSEMVLQPEEFYFLFVRV